MLFHLFNSQDERRAYGGSGFIEMQFCRLPVETPVKKLVAVKNIKYWQNDSLYIDDVDTFYNEYKCIFNRGTYSNLKYGTVDVFGINYYAPSLIGPIIESLHESKPTDHEVLMDWLVSSKKYNGFYILGV